MVSLTGQEIKQLAMHYAAMRMTDTKDVRSIIEDYVDSIQKFQAANEYLKKIGFYETRTSLDDEMS